MAELTQIRDMEETKRLREVILGSAMGGALGNRYTYSTQQHGFKGASAAVFCNGVHVWTSPTIQTFIPGDTDRRRAARAAREYIRDRKQV